MELRRFFDRALGAGFRDLALPDDPAIEYLAELLTRFARIENLYPRGLAAARLETVVDMLLDAQAAWQPGPDFQPEREIVVRRHIGDYTLFMTGIFPECVERTAGTGYYVAQGKQAYRFVSEHERTSPRAGTRAGAPLYRRLADRFESYSGALDYARRVYFGDHPSHPFFRLGFS